ncbi:MAG: stage V sporulation protein AD, partial [Oscillibacter sp.]|nr:stage V sporulation protein AD [Oscillibacter sp.]
MSKKRVGRRTVRLDSPPSILSFAATGGKLEKQGPLAACFDELCEDSFLGEKTWEKAESRMQQKTVQTALDKAKLHAGDLDYIFAGDLLNQCIGTSFGLREFEIPF